MIALLPVSIQMIPLSNYGNVRPEMVVQFRFPPQWGALPFRSTGRTVGRCGYPLLSAAMTAGCFAANAGNNPAGRDLLQLI